MLILILLLLAAFSFGLIALFAGRRFYALWLGFAAFFFVYRLFDLALVRLPETVSQWGSLALALAVAALVVALRRRITPYVPPLGGFLVGAMIAERVLALVAPETGKFLFFVALLGGGLLGLFLFQKLFDFDGAVVVLSALWGAGYISSLIGDFFDTFLITAAGLAGTPLLGFLGGTQIIYTLLWLLLAALGMWVQFKIIGYKPLPEAAPRQTTPKPAASPFQNHTARNISALIGGLLLVFVLLSLVAGNSRLSRSIRTSVANLERSLGLEAGAPGDAPWEWAATLLRPQLELQPDDRLLVLVPHPDDDILSAGGLEQQALDMGLPIRVVFLTSGDYNESSFALYRKQITLSPVEALRIGETRREEATVAQSILGVQPEQLTFLGYPDGGTLEIFERHWGQAAPYRGLLSGMTSVPYAYAQSFEAPYKGESILNDLETILRDFRPTKIITSHPGDVHPDHQSLPLYLQVALWDLRDEMNPDVYHFITHYGRWPQPRGYQPEHPLDPPAQFDVDNRWRILPLSEEQRQKKLEALQAHKTQWGSGKGYLESVVRANELFDVLDEVPLGVGATIEALPSESGVPGESLALKPEDVQAAFVDTQMRTITRTADELVMTISFDQPIKTDVSAKVWAIGYRDDTSFDQMPKIFLNLSTSGFRVYNQGQRLPADAVTVNSDGASSEVRIPLALLGDPQQVMVSAQTNLGEVPLDNIPWLFLNLQAAATP